MQDLDIIYQDDHYVAIDKPAGLLVHRTRLATGRDFALQMLRDQIGQRIYPVHRLDRPTSGVLVFGLSSRAAHLLTRQFERREVEKRYLGVVRGYTDEEGVIDYPLAKEEQREAKPAVTRYRRLARVELDVAVGRYPTSRYSLVEVRPMTGRLHQIRRHFAHIRHPLIGDTTHGEGRHNRFFRERYGIRRLLLMASSLGFLHPFEERWLTLKAAPDDEWRSLFDALGWTGTGEEGLPAIRSSPG